MITNNDGGRRLLEERGIKPTIQRVAALEAVLGSRAHPTIRSLHEQLVKTVPTLSKTTLYSTLELFARKGLVRRLFIDPDEVRVDGLTVPHHHFHCASCGRILDIDITCVHDRTGGFRGHRIDEVHGYFRGVCRDCLRRSDRRAVPARAQSSQSPQRRHSHA